MCGASVHTVPYRHEVELWKYAGRGPASPHWATLVFIEWNLKADWLLTSNVLHSGPKRCGAVSVSSQLTYISSRDPLELCAPKVQAGIAKNTQTCCDDSTPPTMLNTFFFVCLFDFHLVKIPFRWGSTRARRDRLFYKSWTPQTENVLGCTVLLGSPLHLLPNKCI